jgi:hypothetical protein
MKLFTKTNQTPKLFTKVGNVGNKLFAKMDQSAKAPVHQVGNFIAHKNNNLEKSVHEKTEKQHFH